MTMPAGRQPKNKAHFVVGLKVEVHHAAQHGGEVMRRTLVQLERLMLPQTSEAVVRAHANKTKNKQCLCYTFSVELLNSELSGCDSCAILDARVLLLIIVPASAQR